MHTCIHALWYIYLQYIPKGAVCISHVYFLDCFCHISASNSVQNNDYLHLVFLVLMLQI